MMSLNPFHYAVTKPRYYDVTNLQYYGVTNPATILSPALLL